MTQPDYGAIVLNHDIQPNTAAAAAQVFQHVKANGWVPVPMVRH